MSRMYIVLRRQFEAACASRSLAAAVLFCVFCIGIQKPLQARELVTMDDNYPMGAIVVSTSEKRLYYSLGHNLALRYRVAVGKPSAQWFGESFVQRKAKEPGWTPTANMRRKNPYLPRHVRGGIPQNPLGARAIYLGWTEYRIHGTNAPGSIGSAASSGCFRMLNADVKDLYERVHIGAPVYVVE